MRMKLGFWALMTRAAGWMSDMWARVEAHSATRFADLSGGKAWRRHEESAWVWAFVLATAATMVNAAVTAVWAIWGLFA